MAKTDSNASEDMKNVFYQFITASGIQRAEITDITDLGKDAVLHNVNVQVTSFFAFIDLSRAIVKKLANSNTDLYKHFVNTLHDFFVTNICFYPPSLDYPALRPDLAAPLLHHPYEGPDAPLTPNPMKQDR